MNTRVLPRLLSRSAIALLAVLGLAAVVAASARAAFPGVPGPIVYPKHVYLSSSESGLFLHGPRLTDSPRALTNDFGSEYQDSDPSFSANGRLIAFSANREPRSPPRRGIHHIYVMNVDGSGTRALTSGEFSDAHPAFSRDGRRIVFDREAPDGRGPNIFSINLDGSGLRQLTRGPANDTEPVFTPNSNRIIFTSNRDRESGRDRKDIFSMAPDGSRVRVLIDGPNSERQPEISPNGRRIVFVSRGENDERGALYIANSGGEQIRTLTACPLKGYCRESDDGFRCPTWAPDGKHIAFINYDYTLEVMPIGGSRRDAFENRRRVFDRENVGGMDCPTWGRKLR